MGASHIELPDFITRSRLEYAHHLASKHQALGHQAFADTGWRAARARDPKLLKALEAGAEILNQMTEEQHGQTMRSVNATYAESKGTTEEQLWREAYRLCDEGNPIRNFEWIYGAAAWLCGYNC